MESTQTAPLRLRSFEDCQVHTPWLLRNLLGRGFAPSAQEYSRLETGLWQGDAPMDAFVDAVFRSGQPSVHWQQFQRALANLAPGVSSPVSEYPELQALLESARHLPFEVDWEKADRGARFIHGVGTLATDVLRDMALMGGYLMASFNQTLVLTGDLEKGAASRLANTSQWWLKVTNLQANRPGQTGFAATLRVRWIHAMVRRHVQALPEWNAATHGLPINQVDMAATYLGFSGVMLLGLRKSGIHVSKENSLAVMHLWKVIAWQMGVGQEWLVDTEAQALVSLRQFVMTHSPPDATTHALAKALAEEPLSRHYASLSSLRRRLAWLSHLSSSSWLLGPSVLDKLGVSSPLGPWLKPLELAPKAGRFYLLGAHPGLRQRREYTGRKAQIRAVAEIHFDPGQVKKEAHPAAKAGA